MTARDASNVTGALLPDRTARVFKKPVANPQFDEIEFLVGTAGGLIDRTAFVRTY
jgi:hypothetical protein